MRSEAGQLLQNLGLLVLRKIFQDRDGIVGIEFAHAFGDGLGRKLVEDFLADRVVDFRQRREVEVLSHQFDEARPQIGIERLDHRTDIGLVKVAQKLAQLRRIRAFDRLPDPLDEFGAQFAVRPT